MHRAFKDIYNTLESKGDQLAIIDKDDTQYTFNQLKNKIVGARKELIDKGIKKGDKILVFVPMSADLYAVLEACFSIGAIAMFLDPWMGGRKMSEVIKDVQPDLLVATKKINRLARLMPVTWKLKKWKINSISEVEGPWLLADVKDEDNALITFTSGTSGKPKGANRTFDFLYQQSEMLKHHLKGETSSYRDYTNFPIVGLASLALGNTIVIPKINLMKIAKSNSEEITSRLKRMKVNRVVVSPFLLNKINEKMNTDLADEFSHVATGGAPISKTLIERSIKLYRGSKLEAIYGSTESEPISTTSFDKILNSYKNPKKGVFVGKIVDEIELKIIRPTSKELNSQDLAGSILLEGEIGEVIVTGNHVNKSYYKNEKAFKENKIVDSQNKIWHRTGDIGCQVDGELFLVGREHRIMKSEVGNIYPYPAELLLEVELGLTDVGYVQKNKEFILYIGQNQIDDKVLVYDLMKKNNYPIDKVIVQSKPLPRDARHNSKLQINQL